LRNLSNDTLAIAEGDEEAATQARNAMWEAIYTAIAEGDEEAATQARNAMWEAIYTVYRQIYDLGDAWNALAPRATECE
jgi:DNA-binding FadR family transcriptional regulator